MSAAIMANPATPPTTPPAIAPVFEDVDDSAGAGSVGVGSAVFVVDVVDLMGVLDDVGDVEAGVDVVAVGM